MLEKVLKVARKRLYNHKIHFQTEVFKIYFEQYVCVYKLTKGWCIALYIYKTHLVFAVWDRCLFACMNSLFMICVPLAKRVQHQIIH